MALHTCGIMSALRTLTDLDAYTTTALCAHGILSAQQTVTDLDAYTTTALCARGIMSAQQAVTDLDASTITLKNPESPVKEEKNVIIIVCMDENQGLLFNGRRQSRDRLVTEDILTLCRGKRLYIAAFSSPLFEENSDAIQTEEKFLSLAEEGAFCFVENQPLRPYLERIEAVIVYRWNRVYPADFYFDLSLDEPGWRCVERREFPGYSHETITREVYLR